MAEPTQPATAFEWVGGEAAVRSLVDRFYAKVYRAEE